MKNIPYIIIAFLIVVIALKDCEGRGNGTAISSDTVKIIKIDTVYLEVSETVKSNPKIIKETDTVHHYTTISESCDKPHLNEQGIGLLKHRNYRDTVKLNDLFISYNADVIGELRSIDLSLNGIVPILRESTIETINKTKEKNHSIGAYINYNVSPQIGLEYTSNKIGYGLNYDLDYKSIGVQIKYTPFKW